MKQAIAGVAPPGLEEVTVMTVWPSVAATGVGRLHGRLFAIKSGYGMFTIGRMFALLAARSAPLFYFYYVVAVCSNT